MKIKVLLFVLGAGFVLASCTDKEAEAKIKQLEADMHIADSTCQAGMLMMQTQSDSLQGLIDSMMMSRTTSTSTTTKTTTTKSEPVKQVDPPAKKKDGTGGIDIKKKTGTNQGGGL